MRRIQWHWPFPVIASFARMVIWVDIVGAWGEKKPSCNLNAKAQVSTLRVANSSFAATWEPVEQVPRVTVE